VARIHPEILEKLQKKLGINKQWAYKRIAARAGQSGLPRHLAALKLAAENGININKKEYATDAERARLAGAPPPPLGLAAPAPAVAVQSIARKPAKGKRKTAPTRKSNSVFVVHGRDQKARDAMFEFLRAIALQPIEWTQAVKATKKGAPYVGEVLNAAFDKAAAVVVLLTPDDEARLKKKFPQDNRSRL
jgi:hypothetical protein